MFLLKYVLHMWTPRHVFRLCCRAAVRATGLIIQSVWGGVLLLVPSIALRGEQNAARKAEADAMLMPALLTNMHRQEMSTVLQDKPWTTVSGS